MTLADSNVFIAYFRLNEAIHKKARKLISSLDEIIINDYVLSEIYTVLMLRESYDIAHQALMWITRNPKIRIERLTNKEIKSIVSFIEKNTTKLSFVDISLLVMSKNRNYQLLSFDRDLNLNYTF